MGAICRRPIEDITLGIAIAVELLWRNDGGLQQFPRVNSVTPAKEPDLLSVDFLNLLDGKEKRLSLRVFAHPALFREDFKNAFVLFYDRSVRFFYLLRISHDDLPVFGCWFEVAVKSLLADLFNGFIESVCFH